MPGLDPGIYRPSKEVFILGMDGRVKPGHDQASTLILFERKQESTYSAAAAMRSGNAADSAARSAFSTPRSVINPVTNRAGVTSKA
jgi:hypothetical protein